ncbi:extracellular solute-binding protein [Puniceicoccus vermicola]|uniref:Extracellular solute-binding protein n=1 Tax=Puniceicoccus vermicola TaxID=388746 RepID=A0A7X1AYG4_9BACT|nr:extracellular solute-binding protein [Puniceicoccus vermicola]MBC2602320.1 extracellular solute-binding protein [Puniceicoccus vermicola]
MPRNQESSPSSRPLQNRVSTSFFFGFLSTPLLFFLGCTQDESLEGPPDRPAEILFVGDPFAYVLEQNWEKIEDSFGDPVNLKIERYSNTRRSIIRNAQDSESFYNLVSFDILWLPHLAQNHILDPISEKDLEEIGIDPKTFYPQTIESSRYEGELLGIPIQPHFELMFYRKDWLEAEGLAPPRSFEELLEQARLFHSPEDNRFGICWNGLRGQAFGQTIAHLYASFGSSIVNDEGEPQIDTETGEKVLVFLQELLAVSPPDVLTMAWDQRIERFQNGQSAFTYGWGARAMTLEHDPASQVAGRVGYSIPPGENGFSEKVPLGQWNLGLPANLTPDERQRSLRLLKVLLSSDVYEMFADSGLENLYRKPPAGVAQSSEYLRTSREIFANDRTSEEARPRLENWTQLADILGTTFHDALLGRMTNEEALRLAQARADEAMGLPLEPVL